MPRARPFPWQPDIRASDAERERVVRYLAHHGGEGRLTAEELEERTGAAYRAVWRGELLDLCRDLPGSPFATRAPVRRQPRPSRGRRALIAAGVSLLMLAAFATAVPGEAWLVLVAVSLPFLLLGVPLLMVAFALFAPALLVVFGVVWVVREVAQPRRPRYWIPPTSR